MIAPREKEDGKVGAVLVLGGGIGGIQASLDLAESGQKVYLLERSPAIGGNMARLDKTFPTNDCSMCILSPKLVECGRHLNIDLITLADMEGLTGDAGRFRARVRRRARYVDVDKCTGCGTCLEQCPVRFEPRFAAKPQTVDLTQEEAALLQRLIASHGTSRTGLMRILQEVNEELRYIPRGILVHLAETFSVPVSNLYRLVTFYTAFSLTPRGRHMISVCTGTACHIKGAGALLNQLKRELQIDVGGTTEDMAYSLESVRCLGCCSLAPVVKVDDRVYGGVKVSELPKIVNDHRGSPPATP